MTRVTCRLTAKNRDQLRNPTLGKRVWATFTYLFKLETRPVLAFCGAFRAEYVQKYATEAALREQESLNSSSESSLSDFSEDETQEMEL